MTRCRRGSRACALLLHRLAASSALPIACSLFHRRPAPSPRRKRRASFFQHAPSPQCNDTRVREASEALPFTFRQHSHKARHVKMLTCLAQRTQHPQLTLHTVRVQELHQGFASRVNTATQGNCDRFATCPRPSKQRCESGAAEGHDEPVEVHSVHRRPRCGCRQSLPSTDAGGSCGPHSGRCLLCVVQVWLPQGQVSRHRGRIGEEAQLEVVIALACLDTVGKPRHVSVQGCLHLAGRLVVLSGSLQLSPDFVCQSRIGHSLAVEGEHGRTCSARQEQLDHM